MPEEQPPQPGKEKKLSVWSLGVFGVNVCDSPLHLVDGELTKAQNAEPFTDEGEGGIRKREGIDEFTPATLDGEVFAISSIPLPDPTEDWFGGSGNRLYYNSDAGTRRSVDGDTWENAPVAMTPEQITSSNQSGYINSGTLYYVSSTATALIRRFNGSANEDFLTMPADPDLGSPSSIQGMTGQGTTMFVLCVYGPSGSPTGWIVQRVDLETAAVTKFAQGFKLAGGALAGFIESVSNCVGPVIWQDELWVTTISGGNTQIRRVALTGTSWSTDNTIVGTGSLAIYGAGSASLWFTTRFGGASELRKRTAAGVYSIVLSTFASAVFGLGEKVYAIVDGDLQRTEDDGATWDTLALSAGSVEVFTRGVIFKGDTYLMLANVYRDDGASATIVDANDVNRWGVVIL